MELIVLVAVLHAGPGGAEPPVPRPAPTQEILVGNDARAREIRIDGNLRIALGMKRSDVAARITRHFVVFGESPLVTTFRTGNFYMFFFDDTRDQRLTAIWVNGGY